LARSPGDAGRPGTPKLHLASRENCAELLTAQEQTLVLITALEQHVENPKRFNAIDARLRHCVSSFRTGPCRMCLALIRPLACRLS